MDQYDIFKKLSRGARFKTKRPHNFVENTIPAKKIKLENNDKTEKALCKQEPMDYREIQKDEDNDSGVDEDKELILLGSITATESGRKPKKKKKEKIINDDKKKKLLQEEINHYRNVNNINVVGRRVPTPVRSFEELKIGRDLIENLVKCGYSEPTPIQKQAIPIMLERRQILACAPTGSGKTAAFLLPILHSLDAPQRKGFRAVVVCPTRELAKQTQRECARLSGERGFRVHIISKINQGLTQYGPKSNQKFDILVTTPNRLCFLLNQDPPALSLANVEWLVIDEADKLFEEGVRGFREQLTQVIKSCTSTQLQIAMFSATQTVDVGRWCRKNMKGLINVTVGQRNAATDLVEQELLFVGNEGGKLVAFRNLVQKGLHPPVLVFVQSKDRAQQLFQELIYDGINVDVIHADRTQLQRDNTVRCFREGKIWVLICTELMARGVDFKGVNLVINYDFPPSAIAYIHRIGRAGRAGRKGKAITFFTTEDTTNLRSIAHVLKQSGCDVPDFMLAMKKRSKKERNKVLPRRDISTKPKYLKEKYAKNKTENNDENTKKKKKTTNEPSFDDIIFNNDKSNKKKRKRANHNKDKENGGKMNVEKQKKKTVLGSKIKKNGSKKSKC